MITGQGFMMRQLPGGIGLILYLKSILVGVLIIIKDINGEDGVIVISGFQTTKATKVGAYRSTKSGEADYTMYAMNIYKNTTILDYIRRSENGQVSVIPDALMWVSRDAYNNSSKSKKERSS